MQTLLRKTAWRLGRKLYCWGRGDVPNNPGSNGEYWILKHFISHASDSMVLLDVGANKGAWSLQAIAVAAAGKSIQLYAFEPSAATREILQRNLSAHPGAEICALALSSVEGQADFFTNGIGSGTNSLNPISGTDTERVQLSTVDAFTRQRGIESIGMMKVDTEGFDLDVLKGAESSLARGAIELIQFEYNWRWLQNHASLFDVFNLVVGTDYRVGKLVKGGIIIYERWHFEIDRYFEANYLLLKNGSEIARLAKTYCFDINNVLIET